MLMETPVVIKMLTLGLAAGVLSGMFGIGGGLVIVPALVMLMGFDTKTAVGTSLFVILLPTGLLGVREYWKNGDLNVPAALLIALGVFVGAYFGARVAGAISATAMKRTYAIFLLVVGVYFLVGPQVGGKKPVPIESTIIRPNEEPLERPAQIVH